MEIKRGFMGNMTDTMALTAAIGTCASILSDWLDRNQITPEALQGMAERNESPVLSALSESSNEGIRVAQTVLRRIQHRLTPDAYMKILQEDCLSVRHAPHVQVIVKNLAWYGRQMQDAIRLISGNG